MARSFVRREIMWGHEPWARVAVDRCLRHFGNPPPIFRACVRFECCYLSEHLPMALKEVVFSSPQNVCVISCNSYGIFLQWWGCIWFRLGALWKGMAWDTLCSFLTSLAYEDAMSKLGSNGV